MSGDSRAPPRQSALEEWFYPADAVRFVYWREFTGAKPAVALVGLVAVLSFVTGLSHLSRPPSLDGPLATVLPGAESVVPFAGVLLAFVVAVLTVLLRRRKRLAWYGAVVALALVGLLPLATLQATDVPLLVLVVVALPLLVRNRDRFDRRVDLSPLQVASLLAIVGVVAYGAVGTFALREDFTAIESLGDSVYYVIVTIATVGYGDITPTTARARWFSLSVILLGTGAFTVAIGSLVVPAIESRMAAAFGTMTASELHLLEDHVLVLGHGDVTASLLEELVDRTEVVVVTPDQAAASRLAEADVEVLTADPTDAAVLRDASIEDARGVVVATRDDARDVMAVLAAREAAPGVHVVAAANEPKHVAKLEQVGADEVISPMAIAGRLLGRSVLERREAGEGEPADDAGGLPADEAGEADDPAGAG